MLTVKAYLGLGSRYSYLAATRLDRLAAETKTEITWIPVDSTELIRRAHGGASPFEVPKRAGQYDEAYRHRDAQRWAEAYGVSYHAPDIAELPSNLMALACWCLPEGAARKALMKAFFVAVFASGQAVSVERVVEICSQNGVAPDALLETFEGGPAAEAHAEAIEVALAEGVFGVPSFVVAGDVFWGNDRLSLLRRRLLASRGKA